MPGSWEYPDHGLDVLIATPHVGIVPSKFAWGLRALQLPARWDIAYIDGAPFDHARNYLAAQAIERDAEWLFFLDSDVVPPPDALTRLIAMGQPLVSGVYYKRSDSLGPCIWKDHPEKGSIQYSDYPKTLAFRADLVGAGCLLINRSILEKLPRTPDNPWFRWTLDKEPAPIGCSEDFYFLRRVRKELGIRPVVNPSVQCEHVGMFASGKGGPIPAGSGRTAENRMDWIRARAIGTIVDIGCHDGEVFGKEAYANRVTGVDLDVYPLKQFIQADAASIPLPDRSFDSAVVAEILEHVPDPVAVLREAKRLARMKVIISTPNEHEWDPRHKPFHPPARVMAETGKSMGDLVAEGTRGATAVTDEVEHPHLWHVRQYDEIALRGDLQKVFGKKYTLDVLRYDGWSFFVAEADVR